MTSLHVDNGTRAQAERTAQHSKTAMILACAHTHDTHEKATANPRYPRESNSESEY